METSDSQDVGITEEEMEGWALAAEKQEHRVDKLCAIHREQEVVIHWPDHSKEIVKVRLAACEGSSFVKVYLPYRGTEVLVGEWTRDSFLQSPVILRA